MPHLISPPDQGGQRVPQPVPHQFVEEDAFLPFKDMDFETVYMTKPSDSEIKLSNLENSYFYLSEKILFIDKRLPDPYPTFLQRLIPHPTFSPEYFISLSRQVSGACLNLSHKTYNYCGSKIPLAHSSLVIPAWRSLFADYSNQSLIDKLEFGFPIGISSEPDLAPAVKNHTSSYKFHSWVDKFCIKEVSKCGLTGPLATVPFDDYHISPLMTAPKKPDKRRVVFDATYGISLNKSTPKEFYLDEKAEYDFPKLDDFEELIIKVGDGALMWKRDLERYFLQLPIDPMDYPKTGFIWRSNYFFFTAFMFGLRHSGLAGQQVTSAINWRHRQDGKLLFGEEYNTLNYSDDLAGVENEAKACIAFTRMGELLQILGLKEAIDKASPPTTQLTYLGVTFDSVSMKKTVPAERVAELQDLLISWSNKRHCTKRSLQSLCGKLLWVAKCVRHSRVFLTRLLAALKVHAEQAPYFRISLSDEMLRDIQWWCTYLRVFNGVNFIIDPSHVKFSYKGDACPSGGGGYFADEYWSSTFPEWLAVDEIPIHLKEFWVLLISIKLWGSKWSGSAVELYVDNTAVCLTCTNQKPSNLEMASFLREYLFLVVKFKFHPIIRHIGTVENKVADFLSRNYSSESICKFLETQGLKCMKRLVISDIMFRFTSDW